MAADQQRLLFEIHFTDGVDPRYFWHLVTSDRRILGWSENYRTKAECVEAIASIVAGAPTAGTVDRTDE